MLVKLILFGRDGEVDGEELALVALVEKLLVHPEYEVRLAVSDHLRSRPELTEPRLAACLVQVVPGESQPRVLQSLLASSFPHSQDLVSSSLGQDLVKVLCLLLAAAITLILFIIRYPRTDPITHKVLNFP